MWGPGKIGGRNRAWLRGWARARVGARVGAWVAAGAGAVALGLSEEVGGGRNAAA